MAGFDRDTFRFIDNLPSALQGVEDVLSTRLYSRLMLREYGAGAIELLGRLVNARLFDMFRQLVATAIDIWEPRFKVRRIYITGSVEDFRQGRIGLRVEADYRPGGHLDPPDYRVENVQQFDLFFRNTGVVATQQTAP